MYHHSRISKSLLCTLKRQFLNQEQSNQTTERSLGAHHCLHREPGANAYSAQGLDLM